MSHDLYHDPGHVLIRSLLELCPGAKGLVKGAEFEDTADAIPEHAFAWAGPKLYPVHSPAHAVVSYLYAKHASAMTKTASLMPRAVLDEIEEALDVYGVDRAQLAPVIAKVAALEPEECLFPERQEYPVRNAEEVKLAEQALLAQMDRMVPQTRFRVFNKLAALAEQHGVTLDDCSTQWAGETETDRKRLGEALAERAKLSKTAAARSAYETLATVAFTDRYGFQVPEKRAALALKLAELDKAANITRLVPDAFRTVYNTTVKTGSATLDLCGSRVDPDHLGRLPASFYSDALGKDCLAEVAPGGVVDGAKVAEVVATLPADMKADFARQLKAAGVQVV